MEEKKESNIEQKENKNNVFKKLENDSKDMIQHIYSNSGYATGSNWSNSTPKEKKRFFIFSFVILVLFTLGIIYSVYSGPVNEFFNDLASKEKNPFLYGIYYGLPRILNSLVVIFITIFVIRICRIIYLKLNFKNQKSRTVANLIYSFIKYLLWFICVILVLISWGVNATGIIASAGIMTVFVGFGVQTVVSDLVSGLFIVFEGNIEVGDIVTFGGFKGTIRSIGFRITIIENMYNDLNIVRNSEIKSIINNSKNNSQVLMKFPVNNSVPVNTVEEALKKALPAIKEKCPDIQEDIQYIGITEMTTGASTYTIALHVKEKRSLQTQRIVYHELRSLLDQLTNAQNSNK